MSTFGKRVGFGFAVVAVSVGGVACVGSSAQEDTGESTEAITPIYGVDYSFARPSPTSIKNGGYKFVARYLSDDPGKTLSLSEAHSLEAAGLSIVSNWEDSSTNALNGYNQGVSDATKAKAQAASDGAPSTRPIYFSVDFDASSSQLVTVEKYFEGVASVIGLARTGAYGGYNTVKKLFDEGKIKWAWQTYAWSYGQWDSRAQLRQIENGIDNDEEDKDEAVVSDYGQWGQAAPIVAPRGYLDTADCTAVAGWSEEESAPSKTITVDVYFNGPAGGAGVTAFKLSASTHRADLCTAIGSCDHGFSMDPPRSLLDDANHKVYAYGVNPTSGGPNALLSDAPKTLKCAAPAIPAGDVKRHVINPTSLADWKFDEFTDMAPYSTAKLAAVTTGVDLDATVDLVQVPGTSPIYIVDGTFKRHVTDPTSFAAWRFTSAAVKHVTAAALAALTTGPAWPATPLLVKDPTAPAVYMLDVPLPAVTPPVSHDDAGTAHEDAGTEHDDAGAAKADAGDTGHDDAGAVEQDAATLDAGSDAAGDAETITFTDGGVVVDDGGSTEPVMIEDGGGIDPSSLETDAGTSDSDSGTGDEGKTSSQPGSSGGCAIGRTSEAPDASWIFMIVGGLVASVRGRRRSRLPA